MRQKAPNILQTAIRLNFFRYTLHREIAIEEGSRE